MARILVFTMVLILLAPQSQADLRIPLHEIQAFIRTHELFKAMTAVGGVRYAGNMAQLCEGGPATIAVHSIDVRNKGFLRDSDARYGAEMSVRLSTHLTFDGKAPFCGFDGPVACESDFALLGLLTAGQAPKGRCRSTQLGLLTLGFETFGITPLLAEGVSVEAPGCTTSDDGFA